MICDIKKSLRQIKMSSRMARKQERQISSDYDDSYTSLSYDSYSSDSEKGKDRRSSKESRRSSRKKSKSSSKDLSSSRRSKTSSSKSKQKSDNGSSNLTSHSHSRRSNSSEHRKHTDRKSENAEKSSSNEISTNSNNMNSHEYKKSKNSFIQQFPRRDRAQPTSSKDYQRILDIMNGKITASNEPSQIHSNESDPYRINIDDIPYDSDDSSAEGDFEPPPNKRQRFIIYVAGLEPHMNTVKRIYSYFHTFGRILGIQVKRDEKFALVEFNDLRSAYGAISSKKPAFDNKLIKLGFASEVDESMIEMFKKKEEETEIQSIEIKADDDLIDSEGDYSLDETDSESYDMPDVKLDTSVFQNSNE
ncbi:hypothetical protein TRFO_21343 [Tritrichomonas foetus]|uniref:RRM domain-containing protein n=1 Tax=Tritrichomonas foetus TaxID=1144522 RepID=A0A1J4KE58_9EUKA|nr:hypothetical protein TRFO_21343 [Tritrichomonas foetus]|eukprot:OHT09713.1 hypothetical protein TRFO_21343 [Tritrichomonas foetus]